MVNMVRGLLAEFGNDIPKASPTPSPSCGAAAGAAHEVPELAAKVIGALAEQAIAVQDSIQRMAAQAGAPLPPGCPCGATATENTLKSAGF
jgi:hypothetical protein